jgi:DoxX-like family
MITTNSGITQSRLRAGNILLVLPSLVLIGSSLAKFAHVPKVVAQMGSMGFDGGRLTFIAVLEIVSAILFLLPRTRSFGLLMVSAFLGGAIATHLGHGQPFAGPAIVLSLFWIATWLRHPQVLWSWFSLEDASCTNSVKRQSTITSAG